MAIRNIVKDGDPILKKVCRPVTEFNEKLLLLAVCTEMLMPSVRSSQRRREVWGLHE